MFLFVEVLRTFWAVLCRVHCAASGLLCRAAHPPFSPQPAAAASIHRRRRALLTTARRGAGPPHLSTAGTAPFSPPPSPRCARDLPASRTGCRSPTLGCMPHPRTRRSCGRSSVGTRAVEWSCPSEVLWPGGWHANRGVVLLVRDPMAG